MKVNQVLIESIIETVITPGLKVGSYILIGTALFSILMHVLGAGHVTIKPINSYLIGFLYYSISFILNKKVP